MKYLIPIFLILLVGCSPTEEKHTKSAFVIDTLVDITIYSSDDNADEILDGAIDLCTEYEDLLSRTKETTPVYELNETKYLDTSAIDRGDEIIYLLNESIKYSEYSDGLFDITIAPLVDLWGTFDDDIYYIPTDEEINQELPKVDYHNIVIDGDEVTLLNDAKVDFGGIAKGYIGDKVKEYLIDNGVEYGLISLGGNIITINDKPDGDFYNLAIKEPFSEDNGYIKIIEVKDKSVVTSGIYERYFVVDDKIYHHILNPRTGKPEDNNIYSVTIVSDESIDGDSLATTLLLMGVDDGLELAKELNIDVLFVLDDLSIVTSEGFEDKYNMRNP